MSAILRQSYLEKIEKYLGRDTIIILTGQRRIGKSYILRLFRDKVSKAEQANVIFIDKEKHEFDSIKNYQDLNAFVDARLDRSKTNYILIAVINYTKFLCDAYLIHKVSRYDIHGKKLFESNDKFYFEDNGLRNTLAGGSREGDIEKVIENIVYNHLIRLGYEVKVGQLQAGKVDFVCKKPESQRLYVPASYIIADDATREREFGNLRAIKDNYPKYVVSMTPLVGRQDSDGIIHVHLRHFLTKGLQ